MAKDFSRKFYNSKEWVKTRNNYFSLQHGRCERCGKPGAIVHHKKRLTPKNINDLDVTINYDNLELLCRECHEEEHRPRDNHSKETMFINGKLIKKPDK